MNVVCRFLSRLFLTVAFLAAGASGCTSNLDTEPVNLPVPFSGALTVDTQVSVSNGPPLHQGILFGHPSGDQWELQDSSGRSVGVVTFFLDTASDPIEVENGRAVFTMNVALDFDDGSGLVGEGVQFFDYPFDVPANFDAVSAAPGEPDALAVSRKGVASGRIVSGTGRFQGAVGQTIDHRYLYGTVRHADGTSTFFTHNLSSWLIHGASGPAKGGEATSGVKVLAVLLEDGTEVAELPGGILKYPLFCEGGAVCGEETDANLMIIEATENHLDASIDVTVCEGASCLTARHARFVGDAVPELQPGVDDGIPFQTTMTVHDPIQCGDATGKFSAAACAGKLNLDYRCLNVFSPALGRPVRTLAGAFIISQTE